MKKRLLPLLVLAACGDMTPDVPMEIVFQATTEKAVPLSGVSIRFGDRDPQVTGQAGRLRLSWTGKAGTRIPVSVQCPEGMLQRRGITEVAMRPALALGDDDNHDVIRVPVVCVPTKRSVVVVVRSAGIPDLPVRANGREVGRTDADGVAHVLLRMPPERGARLVLDTSGRPDLVPASPELFLSPGRGDRVVLFEEKLEIRKEPSKRKRRKRKRRRPKRPVRVG